VVLDLYDQNRRIVTTGRSERYTGVNIIGIAAPSVDAKRALSGQSPTIWNWWVCRATKPASF
jgi:hypothetical protein